MGKKSFLLHCLKVCVHAATNGADRFSKGPNRHGGGDGWRRELKRGGRRAVHKLTIHLPALHRPGPPSSGLSTGQPAWGPALDHAQKTKRSHASATCRESEASSLIWHRRGSERAPPNGLVNENSFDGGREAVNNEFWLHKLADWGFAELNPRLVTQHHLLGGDEYHMQQGRKLYPCLKVFNSTQNKRTVDWMRHIRLTFGVV